MTIFFPVDNKWAKQGWTIIEMSKVRKELYLEALTTAYCEVAPKILQNKLDPVITNLPKDIWNMDNTLL